MPIVQCEIWNVERCGGEAVEVGGGVRNQKGPTSQCQNARSLSRRRAWSGLNIKIDCKRTVGRVGVGNVREVGVGLDEGGGGERF